MIKNYDETEHRPNDILRVIQDIGVFCHLMEQKELEERENEEVSTPPVRHPIGVEIGNANNKNIGSFGTPLPMPAEAIQYYLFDIQISDWKDVEFKRIVSDVPGLGDMLAEIITKEDVSPHRINEINYLAVKIQELRGDELAVFTANIEAGRSSSNITEIINLAVNCTMPQATSEKGAQDFLISAVYQGPEDIPAEHITYSPHLPQLVKVNGELTELFVEMHTFGGDYIRDLNKNLSLLLKNEDTGKDFLLLMDGTNMHLSEMLSVYQKETPEHNIWKNAIQSSEIRAFAVVLVEPNPNDSIGKDENDVSIKGSIIEIDFASRQRDIIQNSIVPQQAHLSVSELHSLDAHLQTFRNQCAEIPPAVQRIPISTREFRADINRNYLSQLKYPDSRMLRIAPEAARELVARGDVNVYRMDSKSNPELLYSMDALKIKSARTSPKSGFAIDKLYASTNEWAKHRVKSVVQQIERDERKKTKHKSVQAR